MTQIGFMQNGINWNYRQMRDFWVEADLLGFDMGCLMDNGVFPWYDTDFLDVFETWTVLPALAEATEHLRLGPMVTPCRRRNPALLAKITSTFDHLSNGRLNLALGTSDQPVFWEPWGMRFPGFAERIAMLREEIAVLKRMWTEKEAHFQGRHYTLNGATCDPKPLQSPHPPIWLGTELGNPAVLRLAAEEAGGLNLLMTSDEACKEILEAFERDCRDVGVDFEDMTVSRCLNVVFLKEDGELDVDDRGGTTAGLFGKRFSEFVGDHREIDIYTKLPLAEFKARRLDSDASYVDQCRLGHRFVIGTPDEIAEELRRQAGLGFDLLVIRGLDSIELLRRFAAEVMPKIKAHRSSQP